MDSKAFVKIEEVLVEPLHIKIEEQNNVEDNLNESMKLEIGENQKIEPQLDSIYIKSEQNDIKADTPIKHSDENCIKTISDESDSPKTGSFEAEDSENKTKNDDKKKRNKPFCEICRRYFSNSANFKLHQRIHTGYKPFSCQLCPKTFTSPFVLREHIKLHDKKPYSCGKCTRNFRLFSECQQHIKTHPEFRKQLILPKYPKKIFGTLNNQSKDIINNVLHFMKSEAEKGSPQIDLGYFKQRVLTATGISERAYRNLCSKDTEPPPNNSQ